MRLNVFGVSDWPESLGERFPIFLNEDFSSQDEAISLARKNYNGSLEVEIEVVKDDALQVIENDRQEV